MFSSKWLVSFGMAFSFFLSLDWTGEDSKLGKQLAGIYKTGCRCVTRISKSHSDFRSRVEQRTIKLASSHNVQTSALKICWDGKLVARTLLRDESVKVHWKDMFTSSYASCFVFWCLAGRKFLHFSEQMARREKKWHVMTTFRGRPTPSTFPVCDQDKTAFFNSFGDQLREKWRGNFKV